MMMTGIMRDDGDGVMQDICVSRTYLLTYLLPIPSARSHEDACEPSADAAATQREHHSCSATTC
jgi:hypothetical protein